MGQEAVSPQIARGYFRIIFSMRKNRGRKLRGFSRCLRTWWESEGQKTPRVSFERVSKEGVGVVLRGCLTANLARVFSHHLFDAEKQGSEIEGIFQMPADVVGIGGAKNTTHIF